MLASARDQRFSGSGAKENRTPDLFHAMEALYQLSYSPICEGVILTGPSAGLSHGLWPAGP
jgi:hypothetical protein